MTRTCHRCGCIALGGDSEIDAVRGPLRQAITRPLVLCAECSVGLANWLREPSLDHVLRPSGCGVTAGRPAQPHPGSAQVISNRT